VDECSFLPYWEDSRERSTRPTRHPGEIQEDPERKEDAKKVQEFQKGIQGRYGMEDSRKVWDRRYKKIHRRKRR
jgi:hypothetical protein